MRLSPTQSNRPVGIPVVTLAERLAHEAHRTRGRYIGSLRDLASWAARNPSPETVAAMLAEVAALDTGLQAVRDLLS